MTAALHSIGVNELDEIHVLPGRHRWEVRLYSTTGRKDMDSLFGVVRRAKGLRLRDPTVWSGVAACRHCRAVSRYYIEEQCT